MNICNAPSTSAAPNTMKASQKWERMSRLLVNTGQPPPRGCELRKGGLVDHLYLAPHALMSDAAKFLARHHMVAWRLESDRQHGDITRHQHGVDVGALDQKAMHHIRAGGAQGDRRVRRHHDALRRERVLLPDRAHGHRAVGLKRAAEIAFDE